MTPWWASEFGVETYYQVLHLKLRLAGAGDWELRILPRRGVTIGPHDHESVLANIRFSALTLEIAKVLALDNCNAWLMQEIDRVLGAHDGRPGET